MRAVVMDGPGPPDALKIVEMPVPRPQPGWVLIKVHAFGLNRSELHMRLGLADGVRFPIVPGIEATGTVEFAPSGEFPVGTQVATLMGGMGRVFNGGYAEYVLVPTSQVIPFASTLDWATLGAVPEMLQTAYGSLTIGLNATRGDTLLVRGGSSSVGMCASALGKHFGLVVLATTRNESKLQALADVGVDHPVLDRGQVSSQIRRLIPGGVDRGLELIGTPTLQDTLQSTRTHGTVCFTGMLSNEWVVHDFYPIEYIPRGVGLTSYSGGAGDLPQIVLQEYLDSAAAGEVPIPVGAVFPFEQIVRAHRAMEGNTVTGKIVITI
jgi:NADPH2:quinone reductase